MTLPELPLGLSLRQHLTQYRDGLEDSRVRQEIDDILRFTEAESRFYAPHGDSPTPGTKSVIIRRAVKSSVGWLVTLQVCTGETVTETVRFQLDAAENISNAISQSVAEARIKDES